MRRYYLHKRKDMYYAELVSPSGVKQTARSTGKTTESEALLVVSQWLNTGISTKQGKLKTIETAFSFDGILKAIRKTDLSAEDAMKIIDCLKKKELVDCIVTKAGKDAKTFCGFLEEFWDYDRSPYVRELKANGQSIHRAHVYEMARRVNAFYIDYFQDRPLYSITRQDLKEFSLFLAEKREKPKVYKGNFAEYLSAAYRTKILTTAKTALKWAFHEGLIPVDPTAGIKKISGDVKKRGILTESEAAKIFNEIEWADKRAYVANLLACTTGMRCGEILALRKSDIVNLKDSRLYINFAWSRVDKLKATKTNKDRKVILYPEVKEKLLELITENPHKVDDPFIFYGQLEDRPIDDKILLHGLFDACKAAGIDHKGRNIVVHGWRHFYSANMANEMQPEKVQRITGHVTKEVFEHYADHELESTYNEVEKTGARVFVNILQFRKAG